MFLVGNKKGISAEFNQELINKLKMFSEQVAQYFPDLHYAGLDILVTEQHKLYLLEINAFGDLLLNQYNKNGLNTYQQEFATIS